MKRARHDDVVVGGGFFGCRLALALGRRGRRVVLVESEAEIMRHASRRNQARVHSGYHYPRSFLTARRSRENYGRFLAEYPDAVVDTSIHLYAVAKNFSAVSSAQFASFCRQIGAPCVPRPDLRTKHFESALIEDVYEVEERCFDWSLIAARVRQDLEASRVETYLGTRAEQVSPRDDRLSVTLSNGSALETSQVYVAAYAETNGILRRSRLPLIHLKQEIAEMALVETPPEFRNWNITVMDGPFWSLMRYPEKGLHTLSHVRYTPHLSWQESDAGFAPPDHAKLESRFSFMRADSRRFVPALSGLRQNGSLWQIKAILPRSEHNDSRPIFFKTNHILPGLHIVVGGKIDNVFEALEEVDRGGG